MIRIHRIPLGEATANRLAGLDRRVADTAEEKRVDRARALWKSARTTRSGLRTTLEEMAPGLGRCMYCGDNQGSDVDHFEPVGRNPLRTFDWLNHLLACSICNGHHKREQFPCDEHGRPLLIDPSVEDPFDHLLLTLSAGVYEPLSARGRTTIEVCGLNRRFLPLGRMRARDVVSQALRDWRDASARGDEDGVRGVLAAVREQPLADVVQSMFRQALSPGAALVFEDAPDVLALLRDEGLRAALLV